MEIGWNFNQSYMRLPALFYEKVAVEVAPKPKLVVLNGDVAKELGLDFAALMDEGAEIFSGNQVLEEGAYIAQAYAGHQFGHFTILGDGRAILIAEQITPTGKRVDLQLKGSGRTPYSRRGDGKATLGPMLREYIISEGMRGLGIPTTRSLAVVTTGERVYRESAEQGAILARVASSHIRVGTFQYAAQVGTFHDVKALANYTIERHFPELKDNVGKYLEFFRAVVKGQAKLIAHWQSVGFIHGVMNTDNMAISGESIDYGPCAFMDRYDPDTVFSSIDTYGRYSYGNQPTIAQWNLCRLAETLLPLFAENEEKAIQMAQEAVGIFTKEYELQWNQLMRDKLGLLKEEESDHGLIDSLLELMKEHHSDYTNTFAELTMDECKEGGLFTTDLGKDWYSQWKERLTQQPHSAEEVQLWMRRHNPAVIPRNHWVEDALYWAKQGDFGPMNDLVEVLQNPYGYTEEQRRYMQVPEGTGQCYRTFCGT